MNTRQMEYIIKNLIENSSRPGDLILDPFLGSGTTAVACMEFLVDFTLTKCYDEFVIKEGRRCSCRR